MLPVTGVFNDGLIAELYAAYQRDPGSVDESWRQFFRVAAQITADQAAPGTYDATLLRKAAGAAALASAIRAYGHLAVPIDPLGTAPPGAAELRADFHRIQESDLPQIPGSALGDASRATAADVI